jgi:hypothetical protein
MQELEKLVLIIPEYHTEKFEREFGNLIFPHIKTLVVSPYCDFAARSCPNLQTMSSNGWPFKESRKYDSFYRNHTTNFIRTAGNVPNLTRLEIDEYWDSERLDGEIDLLIMGVSLLADYLPAVFQAVPGIPSLALNIAVEQAWRDDGLSVFSLSSPQPRLHIG